MKLGIGKQILIEVLAVLLVAVFQFSFITSASGALYPGDWSLVPLAGTDANDAGSDSRDISNFKWVYSGGFYYFRLDFYDTGGTGSFSNNTYYDIYFDTGSGGGSPTGTGLTGIDIGMSIKTDSGGNFPPGPSLYIYTPGLIDKTSDASYSGKFSFDDTPGTPPYLEWKVDETLPGVTGGFSWWGITRTGGGQFKDVTDAVLTPVPNAAWLLASGTIALIAFRRRKNA